MSSVRPVSKTAHASARWKPFKDLNFAAGDAFAPLVLTEARRAALSMPIAFLRHEDALTPVAMQGLQPGRNLLVSPEGRWLAAYLPATYRGYPFSVRDNAEGVSLFCVDEASGLISGVDTSGDAVFDDNEPIDNNEQSFFDASGKMSEPLAEVLEFAKAIASDRVATRKACEEITRCDILEPWRIAFEGSDKEYSPQGLLRVDEARFNQLDAEALLALRNCGALNLLFCHLLSVSQLGVLQRLNKVQGHRFDPKTDSVGQLLGLPDDDVIEFGF